MWGKRRKDSNTEKSKKALQSAQNNLTRVTDRHPEVLEVSSSLRGIRERNHFAEHLTRIMEGHE